MQFRYGSARSGYHATLLDPQIKFQAALVARRSIGAKMPSHGVLPEQAQQGKHIQAEENVLYFAKVLPKLQDVLDETNTLCLASDAVRTSGRDVFAAQALVSRDDVCLTATPLYQVLDELHLDLVGKPLDVRIQEVGDAYAKSQQSAKAKARAKAAGVSQPKADDYSATNESCQAIHGSLSSLLHGGMARFNAQHENAALTIGSHGQYKLEEGRLQRNIQGKGREPVWTNVLPDGFESRAMRPLLILLHDQASYVFGGSLHLMLRTSVRCVFMPGPCHQEHNVFDMVSQLAGLSESRKKARLLGKYNRGPQDLKDGIGGRWRAMMKHGWHSLEGDLWEEGSEIESLFKSRLPLMCAELGIASADDPAAKALVLQHALRRVVRPLDPDNQPSRWGAQHKATSLQKKDGPYGGAILALRGCHPSLRVIPSQPCGDIIPALG